MQKTQNKSLFIVFEGIDKSGKSTQAKMLYNKLYNENYKVLLTREPYQNKIRETLLTNVWQTNTTLEESLLFCLDRSIHIKEVINPALLNNTIVICDRYVYSTIAYQCYGKKDYVSIDLIKKIHDEMNIPRADTVFLFNIDKETYDKRKKELDKIEHSTDFDKVCYGFNNICRLNWTNEIIDIDGRKEMNIIHDKIYGIVKSKIG